MQPDDLYGLALERFIPERTALAKALRAEGRREEAAAAAKLRKPSAAAWAVNQLVRSQTRDVAALLKAGDAVRTAQADVLAGRGDARRLRDAGTRERDAVDALVDLARGLLSGEGVELSATTLVRVADTLHAAALDEDARAAVAEGRLERELRHVGLGLGEGAAVFAPTPAEAEARPERKPKAPGAKATNKADAAAERRAAKERAAAEAAARTEREAARRRARSAAAKAAKREERAGHALRAAEERRERAAQALADADEALEAARATTAQAAQEHERLRAELDAL